MDAHLGLIFLAPISTWKGVLPAVAEGLDEGLQLAAASLESPMNRSLGSGRFQVSRR